MQHVDFMHVLGVGVLGNRLKRLVDQLMQDSFRIYRAAGMGFEPRWVPVYRYLLHAGPSPMTGIARSLGISHAAVSQIAREMAVEELVATYKDTRDKRRRVLALTHKAKTLVPELERLWQDVEACLAEVAGAAGPDFLSGLERVEAALAERSLKARMDDRHPAAS